jgi:hypothetical protein
MWRLDNTRPECANYIFDTIVPEQEEERAKHFGRGTTRGPLLIAGALACAALVACGGNDNEASSTPTAQSAAKSDGANVGSKDVGAGVIDYVKYVGGTPGAADDSKSPIVIGFVNQ